MTSPLISTQELADQLDNPNLVILDGSWHLPAAGRDAIDEYQQQHIPGTRFFDIDDISDKNSSLPHMLPSGEEFAAAVSALGVSDDSEIVVYDAAGIFSAPRVWWTFKVFGHDNIRVLNGGLPKWIAEERPVTAETSAVEPASFKAVLNTDLVATMADVLQNCETQTATVLDARARDRYEGNAPEPRPGVRSGHIPGACSLPMTELLDGGKFKNASELSEIFANHELMPGDLFITSCGSGVTAAIITLALTEVGYGMNRLYDGSWTEWGGNPNVPIE